MSRSDEATESKPRGFHLPRWCKILGTIVLGIAALLVIPLIYRLKLNHDAEARLQEAIAETERLDPRWRFEQVVTDRDVVPDNENSAPHVQAVKALLPPNWPTKPAFVPAGPPDDSSGAAPTTSDISLPDRLRALESVRKLDQGLHDELGNELKPLRPALEIAQPIIALSQGRHEVTWAKNWLETRLEHVQEARPVGELFFFHAFWSAQEGDCDESLRATRGALNAGRSIGDEPTLISQLVRMALTGRAVHALERVLAQGVASLPELCRTQQLMKSEADAGTRLMRKALRAERGAWFGTMDLVADGEISLESKKMTHWDHIALALYIRARIHQSQATHLQWMNQLVESVQLPPKEARKVFSTVESEAAAMKSSADHVLATLFVPSVVKVMDAHYRRHALLDCAVLAIACERFRQKHRRFPDSLEELIPVFVAKIPDDPFDNGPIRYRRLDDGVVIYSVGRDGKDDDGNLNRERPDSPGADIGVRLWDVKHRRQPPAPDDQEQL